MRTRTMAVVFVAVLVGALATWLPRSNPASVPNGFAVNGAESASWYCAGFTGATGVAPGVVSFVNSASSARMVHATITSASSAPLVLDLAVPAGSTRSVVPAQMPGRSFDAVAAVVNGDGVSAYVRGASAADSGLRSPCASAGLSNWSATGLTTTVTTSTSLSLLNPTATTAVVNVTALSANGFAAPTSFQGLVIGPHALVALNINNQIVNAAQLALAVRAVQGTVVPVATESWTTPQAGAAVVGGGGPAATSWFPSVPTGPGDQSNVVLANFSIQPITATLSVKLPPYVISPFVVTVPAESIQSVTISPATRVPAVGHATVIVSSHHALVATLLTSYVGTSDHWLTAPAQPGTAQMVAVNGESFSAVRVSNPSATAVTVSFSTWFFTSSQHVDFTTGSLSIPSRGTSAVIVPKGLDGAWVLFSSPNPVAITATVARADQLNALSGGQ